MNLAIEMILMFSKGVMGVDLDLGLHAAGTGLQDEYDIPESSRPITKYL
jgi:hypothetical protein